MSQFEIYFTTPQHILWDDSDPDNPVIIPDPDNPAIKLARAWQFDNADLESPWGANPKEFNVDIPIYDDVHDEIKLTKSDGITAYSTFIYVEWRGHPVFWGPILDPQWKLKDRVVSLRAYSQLKRWEFHFLRDGDEILNPAGVSLGLAPLNYVGLWLLADAAENKYPQVYPPVGIKQGPNTATLNDKTIKFERGQQVLRSAQALLESSYAPEMVEETLGFGEEPPYYSQMRTADPLELGTDRYNEVIFHGGFGLNNLQDCLLTPGGKIITHAHVLDRDGVHRETRVDTASALENGVWVDWEMVDFDATSDPDGILGDGIGQALVDHYGRPPNFATLTLRGDDEIAEQYQYHWLEDFFHGDTIRAAVKAGGMSLPDQAYRITGVGLHQENQEVGVHQRINVVPYSVGTYDGDDDA